MKKIHFLGDMSTHDMQNAIKGYEYITYKRDNLYIGKLMSLYSRLHIFGELTNQVNQKRKY